MSNTTPILCVAALITDDRGRLALIRSAKPGRAWELPGGKFEDVDAGDWRLAMSREVLQETGLEIYSSVWSVQDVLTGKPVAGARFASTIIVARATATGPLRAGDDAAEARWFASEEIPWKHLSALEARKVIERWARSAPGASDDLVDAVLAHRAEVLKQRPTPAQERAEHMWRLAEMEAGTRLTSRPLETDHDDT